MYTRNQLIRCVFCRFRQLFRLYPVVFFRKKEEKESPFTVINNYMRYSYSSPTIPLSPFTAISAPNGTDVITSYASGSLQYEMRCCEANRQTPPGKDYRMTSKQLSETAKHSEFINFRLHMYHYRSKVFSHIVKHIL